MLSIGLLDLLLVATHEPLSRADVLCDLGIVDLEEETELAGDGILDLCHLIPWTSNLDKLLDGHLVLSCRLLGLQLLRVDRGVFSLPGGSSRQIRLMLFALRMR